MQWIASWFKSSPKHASPRAEVFRREVEAVAQMRGCPNKARLIMHRVQADAFKFGTDHAKKTAASQLSPSLLREEAIRCATFAAAPAEDPAAIQARLLDKLDKARDNAIAQDLVAMGEDLLAIARAVSAHEVSAFRLPASTVNGLVWFGLVATIEDGHHFRGRPKRRSANEKTEKDTQDKGR
jgi:hypothetical protein